ncbi:hypothetical protein O6H91_13G070700 [Diphasiastrum complanatum]|uniref:Uncharacterized protein n=1 Tax=Diphasiastrum complanatum TaxID=34168 RepID=A0ACC2BW04_DIPCM|nr:hypothetical protein O6H91_13G070700 [Diphasiastrum complanatum]
MINPVESVDNCLHALAEDFEFSVVVIVTSMNMVQVNVLKPGRRGSVLKVDLELQDGKLKYSVPKEKPQARISVRCFCSTSSGITKLRQEGMSLRHSPLKQDRGC